MCLVGECVHPSRPLLHGSSSPSYLSRKGASQTLANPTRVYAGWPKSGPAWVGARGTKGLGHFCPGFLS